MKRRLTEIDIMKGIGVLLMVIGHLGSICPIVFRNWIYSFHMPLFFLVSGLFASSCTNKEDYIESIKKKTMQLIVPYEIYCVVFWIIDSLIGYQPFYGADLVGNLLGTDVFGFLWFIYALYFISILHSTVSFAGLVNPTYKLIICIVTSVGSLILSKVGACPRIGSILFGYTFYESGSLIRYYIKQNGKPSGYRLGLLAGIGGGLYQL